MTVSKADRDTNLPEDSAWNEYVSLRIWPHTDLSSEQVKAVRREYFNGTAARVLKVRRALAPYVVQDLRVATDPATQRPRSEEHTSELQSLMRISYAVFCLKKKNIDIKNNTTTDEYSYAT